jgi:hypothetical protein
MTICGNVKGNRNGMPEDSPQKKKCDVNNRNTTSNIMAVNAILRDVCTAHTNAVQEIDAGLR